MTAIPWELLPDSAAIVDDRLVIGGCDVTDVAEEYGTPVFIYDEEHLRSRCREAVEAFGEGVAYASKAFLCKAMAKIAHETGMHIDVATGGEMHTVLSAGVPGDRIVFHGNNKSTHELEMAIDNDVSRIVVDSFDEMDRIASHAQFNGMNMLTGRFARNTGLNNVTGSMWLHIGANMDQREQVFIGTMTAEALGVRQVGTGQIISISTPEQANRNIGIVDEALKQVNKQRADLGAYQNRLEHAVKGLDVGAENLQAAESQIRDANMAHETVALTKNQILHQASNAMLAQANQQGQMVLQLLQ